LNKTIRDDGGVMPKKSNLSHGLIRNYCNRPRHEGEGALSQFLRCIEFAVRRDALDDFRREPGAE